VYSREEHLEGSGQHSVFLGSSVSFANALLETFGCIQSNFVRQIGSHEVEHFLVGHQMIEDSVLAASSQVFSRGLREKDWNGKDQRNNEKSENSKDSLQNDNEEALLNDFSIFI